jgi:LysR family hca operon transcriptional activator
MALEKELGVTLLIRNNQKIELTEAGKIFYNECALLIQHMETVTKKVHAADKGRTGLLRINCPAKLNKKLFKALKIIREQYPDIELIVESYEFSEIPSSIQYDVYDIGFTYNFAVHGFEGLECISVGTDDFSLVVNSRLFPDAKFEDIPEIVKTLPLILPSYIEPPFMKLMLYELQNMANVKKININYVNTTDSVMLDTSLGLGYGIVPSELSHYIGSNEYISYINLDRMSAKGTIVMLYKKENPSELVKSFVKVIENLVN